MSLGEEDEAMTMMLLLISGPWRSGGKLEAAQIYDAAYETLISSFIRRQGDALYYVLLW